MWDRLRKIWVFLSSIRLNRKARRRVYRVANAGLAVAVVYKILDGSQADAWLLLVNVVLGMADAYVPDDKNPQSPDDQSGTE